jgi:hypothetical protein
MKSILYLFSILMVISIPQLSYGKNVIPSKLKKVLKTELGKVPEVVLVIDFKKIRKSFVYPIIKSSLKLMMKKAFQSSCLNNSSLSDFNTVLLGFSTKNTKSNFLAVSGSFSSSTLTACLAKENKFKKVTHKGYPAYYSGKRKNIYMYEGGASSIVVTSGKYNNSVKPGKNTLGTGSISGFLTKNVLIVQGDRKSSKITSFSIETKISSQIYSKGEATFHKTKKAKKFEKMITSKIKSLPLFVKKFLKTFKIKRNNKLVKATYKINKTTLKKMVKAFNLLFKSNRKKNRRTP